MLHFSEIDSTNTYALNNLSNLKDKQVITADTQTNGRGRFNRKWASDMTENLYFSIILKNNLRNYILMNITQYLSVAICDAFKKIFVSPKIKWSNDILINNKKIGGILAESSFKENNFSGIVLGCGLNINMNSIQANKIDQPATSLWIEIAKTYDPKQILELVLNEFFEEYDEFIEYGFSFIRARYKKYLSLNKGDKVTLKYSNDIIKGEYIDIANNGSLVVDINGIEKEICSGEI